MPYKYLLASLLLLAFYLGRRTAPHPLADHRAYMLTEYPDLLAFTLAEVKIDKYLLELEGKE